MLIRVTVRCFGGKPRVLLHVAVQSVDRKRSGLSRVDGSASGRLGRDGVHRLQKCAA